MLMIGRGDYDRVHAGLRQKVVVFNVALGVRSVFQAKLEIRFVDFGDGHAFSAQLLEIAVQVAAAPARADQPVCQPVIRAPGPPRHKHWRRSQRGGEKPSTILFHSSLLMGSTLYPMPASTATSHQASC